MTLAAPQVAAASAPTAPARLHSLDLMRGFVMLLMAVDHASLFFNRGRVSDDGAGSWHAGTALPLAQFMTRFMTHLCAPTFLFLAGAAIAISADRRRRAGAREHELDRDLLVRGAFIAALDLVYMSTLAGHRIFQVLYAIGVAMMLMVVVRRLPDLVTLGLACGYLAFGELLTSGVWHPPQNPSLAAALTVANYSDDHTWIVYPFVPWLCLMALGYVFARRWLLPPSARARAPALLLRVGAGSLVLFLLVRGENGYGNMFLPREDASLAQWLHVSKYPPSLAYVALELGLLSLCLSALLALEGRGLRVHRLHPVLLFGQTALFFYLAHFTLLGLSSAFLPRGGLARAYATAAAVLLVLYFPCLGFRALKARHPKSLLRYV